jgi:hypothetical protein
MQVAGDRHLNRKAPLAHYGASRTSSTARADLLTAKIDPVVPARAGDNKRAYVDNYRASAHYCRNSITAVAGRRSPPAWPAAVCTDCTLSAEMSEAPDIPRFWRSPNRFTPILSMALVMPEFDFEMAHPALPIHILRVDGIRPSFRCRITYPVNCRLGLRGSWCASRSLPAAGPATAFLSSAPLIDGNPSM